MTTVLIDARCTACGLCIVTCPERALATAPRRPKAYDDRCTGCLACVEVCPVDAIAVESASADGRFLLSASARGGMSGGAPPEGRGWGGSPA